MHHRSTRDYAEVLRIEIPQLGEHLFRQSIVEVFLSRVAREVLERKDCEHHSTVRRFGSRLQQS